MGRRGSSATIARGGAPARPPDPYNRLPMNGPSSLAWRIGVDEAGYGPNLGPLVVAASAWLAPPAEDLYESLAAAISATPSRGDGRLWVADSKAVYTSGGGVAALERSVYAAQGGAPATWRSLVGLLGADPERRLPETFWHAGFDPPLPAEADADDVAEARERLLGACGAAGVGTPRLAARLVDPAEFNAQVARRLSKGAALSYVSIGLARRLFDSLDDGRTPVRFTFDKHGGRNRYGALLQEHFPEGWVETLDEARVASRYRVGDRLAFTFRTKGESELPVALASMTAKLLRELAMAGFNAYWAEQVPGLKPTAGYPVDAKRFHHDIAAAQRRLGIEDAALWRNR